MRVAESIALHSVFGYGPSGRAAPVTPAAPVPSVRSGSSWSLEDQAFGAALVREARRDPESPLYGPDARLRDSDAAADDRTVQALEQRDQEVRRNEKERGDAVGGSQYIYQIGPDGRQYAVGSTAHVVRKKDGDGGEEGPGELSGADKALLEKLKARDSLVRGHETAHIMAAGGQTAGPAQYTYQTGPDGRPYAIGGSVNIAVVSSPVNDEDAARQAETARRAATANGGMSLRDMQVAMRATELSARAKNRALDAYAGRAGFGPDPASSPFMEE